MSLSALLLIMLATRTAQAEPGQFPCGYDYLSEAGAWFKMHTQRVFYHEALNTCFSEAAQLASPDDKAIKEAMMSLMVIDDIKYNETSTLIHIEEIHRAHLTHHRDPPAFALTETGKLQQVSRNIKLPHICYKRVPQVLEVNECGIADPEYKLEKSTNHCYKFHRNRNNWFEADMTCKSEGGYLAIINSREEANVIKKIFAENPASSIPGPQFPENAFIGFLPDDYGTWKTVEGQTLSEAGFADWQQGEPNDNDACGTVNRNGKLVDDPCPHPLPFICEKKIEAYRCDLSEVNDSPPYYC